MSNLTAPVDYQPLPSAEVARRIGFPGPESIENIKTLQAMIQQPPFPGQSNYTELKAFIDNKLESVAMEVGSPTAVIERRKVHLERFLICFVKC